MRANANGHQGAPSTLIPSHGSLTLPGRWSDLAWGDPWHWLSIAHTGPPIFPQLSTHLTRWVLAQETHPASMCQQAPHLFPGHYMAAGVSTSKYFCNMGMERGYLNRHGVDRIGGVMLRRVSIAENY